jgi:hypothetical protein
MRRLVSSKRFETSTGCASTNEFGSENRDDGVVAALDRALVDRSDVLGLSQPLRFLLRPDGTRTLP